MSGSSRFPHPHLMEEHALATDPPMAHSTGDFWRRRIRPFDGRSLSHVALEAEQKSAAGIQRLRGQSVSAGTLSGLDIFRLPEGDDLHSHGIRVFEGVGLTRSGEDVHIRPRTLDLHKLPVLAPPSWIASPVPEPEDVDIDTVDGGPLVTEFVPRGVTGWTALPRAMVGTIEELDRDDIDASMPTIMVLLAQPLTVEIPDQGDDPNCPPDRRDVAHLQPLTMDGVRLALFAWPQDANPPYFMPAAGPLRRNHLADRIFSLEAQHGRRGMHPWEPYGLPLCAIGFNPDWTIDFVDTAAVQRMGGQPRQRSSTHGTIANALMADARLRQFSEHLADMGEVSPAQMRAALEFLPPVGAMPGDLFDFAARTQSFFPDSFDISMRPAIVEELGRLVDESASLETLGMNEPDKIELLLPLPGKLYDPNLFVTEAVDPAFAEQMRDLRLQRADAIRQRENLRRKLDALGVAAQAKRGAWPASDLDPAEIMPDRQMEMPLDSQQGLVLNASSGSAHLQVSALETTIRLSPGDHIFIERFVEKEEDPVAFAVALTSKDKTFKAVVGKDEDGTDSKTDQAAGNGWQSLRIPLEKFVPEDEEFPVNFPLETIGIELDAGQMRFGAFGIVSASNTVTYLSTGLMIGRGEFSQTTNVNDFAFAKDTTPAFGTKRSGNLLVSTTLKSFQQRWQQDFLAPALALTKDGGLDLLAADLGRRLMLTNDAIDVGFIRARADIYRLRQYILGRSAASRLITSPALADVAMRDESARANADDLAQFVSRIKMAESQFFTARSNIVADAGGGGGGGGGPPEAATAVTGDFLFPNFVNPVFLMAAGEMVSQPVEEAVANTAIVSDLPIAGVGTNPALWGTAGSAPDAEFSGTIPVSTAGVWAAIAGTTPTYTMDVADGSSNFKRATDYGEAAYFGNAKTDLNLYDSRIKASDIVGQVALPGFVERTVTVAERLTESEAKKAHDYALAGKLAIRQTLIQLMKDGANGITIGDLPAPGYGMGPDPLPNDTDAGGNPVPAALTPVTLGEVLSDPPADQKIYDTRALADDKGQNYHEADYFNAAVAALDDAVALMRLVEGRVDLYQKFLGSTRSALENIRKDADALESYLDKLGLEISELRHDILVVEALAAEDKREVEETNQRRQSLIARYGDRIVFRRPRIASVNVAAPAAHAADSTIPEPLTQCRFEEHVLPPELTEYVSLLHEVPVGWFPQIAAAVARLDRRKPAIRVLERARLRARALPLMIPTPAINIIPGLHRVALTLSAQAKRFQASRSTVASLDMASIARMDLSSIHQMVRDVTSVSDLIDNGRERPGLARLASSKMEEISNVAGCLNNKFSEVDPAIRMRWAEVLSVHDEQLNLTSLAILPEWDSLPIAQRRALHDLTDWLFAQVNQSNNDVVEAISELVRIALLLAAHAPVDQLIPATLIAPVPIKPGGLIPLRAPPDRIFLKQTGIVRDTIGRPVVRFEAAAIGADRIEARIIEDFGIASIIDPAMSFSFGGGLVVR